MNNEKVCFSTYVDIAFPTFKDNVSSSDVLRLFNVSSSDVLRLFYIISASCRNL